MNRDPIQPTLTIAIALIWRSGQLLITRRPSNTHLAGFWEFPGGKVIEGESLVECVKREVYEELGIEIAVKQARAPITYVYPERTVALHPFDCTVVAGKPQSLEVAEWRWISPQEFGQYEFPPANADLISALHEPAIAQEREKSCI